MSTRPQGMEDLARAVKGIAGASTADLVAIAPGAEFGAEELGELGQVFGPVEAVVVLAQRITDPVQMVRFSSGGTYRKSHVGTLFADAVLRDACWRAAEMLWRAGHRAAIPRYLRYGDSDPPHNISYKKAGVLAGLGALGRSQLLIHPEWGPWLVLRAVITDAPLIPDTPIDFTPCDGCERCIEACPVGALSQAGIDREACARDVGEFGATGSGVLPLSSLGQVNCEECLRACPIGEAPPRLQIRET